MQDELINETDEVPVDVATAAGSRKLSYSYAKRHGVIITDITPAGVEISLREGGSNTPIQELRRHYKRPLKINSVNAEEFEKLLQEKYETSSTDEAVEMMEGLGEELDLSSIAQELAEQNISVYLICVQTSPPTQMYTIAAGTGGAVFQANDPAMLQDVFKQIDGMQKVKLKQLKPSTMDYFKPFALVGLILVGLQCLTLFGLRYNPW